jgi:hypothetical protein
LKGENTKKKIIKSFLIILTSLTVFYLILIPVSIIYQDNGQVLSLLSNIHLIVLISAALFLLIILLNFTLSKSAKLPKIEKMLFLCLISGNIMFIFTPFFVYISLSNIDSKNEKYSIEIS